MFQEAGQRLTYGNQYKLPSHTPYYNSIRLQAQELAHAVIPNVVGDGLPPSFVLLHLYEKANPHLPRLFSLLTQSASPPYNLSQWPTTLVRTMHLKLLGVYSK